MKTNIVSGQRHYGLRKDVEDYLKDCAQKGLTKVTISTYRQSLERFGRWMQKSFPYVDSKTKIMAQHLIGFRRYLRESGGTAGDETGVGERTQGKYISIVRSFLRYARYDSQSKAFKGLFKSRVPVLVSARELLPDEINQILAQIEDGKIWHLRDRALIAILACTGMRVSRVCDLDKGNFEVAAYGNGSFVRIQTRIDSQVIFLDERAQVYLKTYLNEREDGYQPLFIRHKPGKSQQDEDSHHRLSRQMVDRIIVKYAERAGLSFRPSANSFKQPRGQVRRVV